MKQEQSKTQSKEISFTIYGEPASKANSRRLVYYGKRPAFIKSAKALAYEKTFKEQVPHLGILMEGDVEVEIEVTYASRRPDLDESVILDCMESFIYKNDRQVASKIITRTAPDKTNPHAKITVRCLPSP